MAARARAMRRDAASGQYLISRMLKDTVNGTLVVLFIGPRGWVQQECTNAGTNLFQLIKQFHPQLLPAKVVKKGNKIR